MRKLSILLICCVAPLAYAGGFGVSGAAASPAAAEQEVQSRLSAYQKHLMSTGQLEGSVAKEINPGPTLRLPTPAELRAQQAGEDAKAKGKESAQSKSGNQQNADQGNEVAANAKNANATFKNTEKLEDDDRYDALGRTRMTRQTFMNVLRNMMPLSPSQIRTLRYLFDRTQRAAATYPGDTPPRPTSSVVNVGLSPGATPPVIRLGAGFVSSLVFLDTTGQPWPIQAYDLGDPQSFNVQWDQKHNSNTLLVQARSAYKSGNLAVMLKGQNTPIMVTLLPGQSAIDYRVDLRVPGFGPNAAPNMDMLPGSANPVLIEFLNGTPPQQAKRLTVSGGPCDVWLYQQRLFVRTPMTLLSPSWLSTMSSDCTQEHESGCVHAYEIEKAPVLLASHRGKIVKLNIKGL